MKTFREFMLIAEAVEDIFGTEEERKRVAERDAAQARRRSARTGMSPEVEEAENKRKAFEKAGLSPEEARRRAYRNVKGNTTNVSGKDVRSGSQTRTQTPPRQPSGTSTQTPPRSTQTRTQTPPRGAQAGTQTPPKAEPKTTQAPPKQPKASTPPPQKPPTSNAPAPSTKPAAVTPKGPGLRARLGKFAGPAASVGSAAYDYKERRSQGQSRTQAATGAVASGAGSELGWRSGMRGGAALGSRLAGPRGAIVGGVLGGITGSLGGSSIASSLSDKLTGGRKQPTEKDFEKAKQRHGVTQSRQIAARSGVYGANKGSAVTGIGGKTTTSKDTKGNTFMSTGAGSQRRTVQLAKTQLIRDPKSGKQVVGDLAFKGGKATYLARPSVASRDTGLGGVFRNISRSTGIGGQRERDAAAAKQEYRTALKNTQTYQKKLGITPQAATKQKLPGRGVGPAKVGPKKVGPKLVGPKIVGPKKK